MSRRRATTVLAVSRGVPHPTFWYREIGIRACAVGKSKNKEAKSERVPRRKVSLRLFGMNEATLSLVYRAVLLLLFCCSLCLSVDSMLEC
jgi:hypothetical protein